MVNLIDKESRRIVVSPIFFDFHWDSLMKQLGLTMLYTIPPGARSTTEYVWRLNDLHTLHLFVCTDYPVEYCIIVGPTPDDEMRNFCNKIQYWDIEKLCYDYDNTQNSTNTPIIVYAMGLSALLEFDERLFVRIKKSLKSEFFNVRLAGIDAAYLTKWSEMREELIIASKDETDPSLQIIFEETLGIF